MIYKSHVQLLPLKKFISEYKELNIQNRYKPVAVGRYGIRLREDIYSKELSNDYSKNKLIYQNTLTVGMGSVQMDIGILSDDCIYSVSPAYHTYHIDGIHPDYLRYCLQCKNQDMFIRYMKRGSRQGKSIDLKRWITYCIPVYPEEEEIEIIKNLNRIEDCILLRKKQLDKLDELVKSQFIEMFGSPIRNDKNWLVGTLKEVTTKIGSGATPKGGNASYKDIGISLIRSMHVYNGYFDYEKLAFIDEDQAKALSNVTVEKEDVLLNITGASVARCCIVPEDILPARVNQHVCILRCDQNKLRPNFLMQLLIGSDYQALLWSMAESAGATRQALTKQELETISIILPPIALQDEFIDISKQADKSKFEIQQSIDKLETLKKSLMQEYFG